ncbi:hypothetical protein [Taklimakanibacter albus]|uniref:Uncharacterized protein n=1 Tax=Taklimakanibacter albus TaxID=2800327 RepID=A0ACC5RBA6_9HYPH|nr:hypothetical protein [Aestuariivirga sp. YIM B02566]MBK1869951.1 hypothetical protein [Aestuariivirga sp. YIM B02566]
MTDIIRTLVLVLFAGTWIVGVLTWFYIVASSVHFFLLASKMELPGYLRFNPLNAILHPRLLSDETLGVRRRIFRAVGLFIALMAFGFLQGGLAYLIGPYVRP